MSPVSFLKNLNWKNIWIHSCREYEESLRYLKEQSQQPAYKCWHFWCMIHQTIFNPQISWRLIKLEYDCSELTAESRNFQWNYFTFLKLLHITPYLKRAWSINIIRTGCCRLAVRRSCGARGPGGGCCTPSSRSGRSSAAARARTSASKSFIRRFVITEKAPIIRHYANQPARPLW